MHASLLLTCAALQSHGGVWESVREWAGTPSSAFTDALAAGGDADGDGIGDLASLQTNPTRVVVRSGALGATLWEQPVPGISPYAPTNGMTWLRDANGDGADDLAVGDVQSSSVHLFSGASGALLWTHVGPGFSQLGMCLADGGDQNGDGTHDVLALAPYLDHPASLAVGGVLTLSGRDGAETRRIHEVVLWSSSTAGARLANAGDVNRDGTDDFLLGMASPGAAVETQLRSGADGSVLRAYSEFASWYGASVANAGDLDGDQVPDAVVGAPVSELTFAYSGATGAALWTAHGEPGAGASWFGKALAGVGDLDGDGVGEVLIGAPQFRTAAGEPFGAVFLTSGRDGRQLARLLSRGDERIGSRVQAMDDVQGDRVVEVALASDLDPAGVGDGGLLIRAWHAGLFASREEISAAGGGAVRHAVRWPTSFAGARHQLLASATGTGPTESRGLTIPLTFDALTRAAYQGAPRRWRNAAGVLDAAGDADAVLDLAPNAAAPWIGRTIWVACVVEAGGVPLAASIARPVAVRP